ERGALEAGAVAGLLPGGRPVDDTRARAEVARVWGTAELPVVPGRDTEGILRAARDGLVDALVVAGVEVEDLPDPAAAREALAEVPFVVSLELRPSAVTEHAQVVFPVAAVAEKPGTFVNWEGRWRPFPQALRDADTLSDLRVLNALADAMDVHLGLPDPGAARRELEQLGVWTGERAVPPPVAGPVFSGLPRPGVGEAVLTTWRMLLDNGRLQDGEPYLAGTARRPVVRLAAATAAEIGAGDGDLVTVATDRGAVTLPLVVTAMPERVVWVPANSPGSVVHRDLGVTAGAIVRISRAATQTAPVQSTDQTRGGRA
ncbi:hypothetical protein TR74_01345, partial [Carbonactinospora thermoautotrophica]